MQYKNKFKKNLVTLQLSDGSSIKLFASNFNYFNEILMDFDLRTNDCWKKKTKPSFSDKNYRLLDFKNTKINMIVAKMAYALLLESNNIKSSILFNHKAASLKVELISYKNANVGSIPAPLKPLSI